MNKTIKALIFFIVCLFSQHVFCQVTSSSKWNKHSKAYDIVIDNKTHGHQVIDLKFKYLRNGNCKNGNQGFSKTVRPGKSTITSISVLPGSNSVPEFNYTYTYYAGKLKTKPDFDYPYLIPIKSGNTTGIQLHSYLWDTYGNIEPPKDWYSLRISTEVGDTIYAARMGVVTREVNEEEEHNSAGPDYKVNFTSKANSLSIEHKDGTIATYSRLKSGSNFVKLGDKVYAGQPIAVADAAYYDTGSHFSLSVYYYHVHPKMKDGEETGASHYHAYVPISFVTTEGQKSFEHCTLGTVAVHDESTILEEMSKKEKKKWRKLNSK